VDPSLTDPVHVTDERPEDELFLTQAGIARPMPGGSAAFVGWWLVLNGAQEIDNQGGHPIEWGTAILDTDGHFDEDSPDFVTIQQDGVYHLWTEVNYQPNADGIRDSLLLPSSSYVGAFSLDGSTEMKTLQCDAENGVPHSLSNWVPLKAGDTVQVLAEHTVQTGDGMLEVTSASQFGGMRVSDLPPTGG
jgi:hypothetical protein